MRSACFLLLVVTFIAATFAASPSGTVVKGTIGSITDSQGNVWAINSNAVVTVNGVVSTPTANVIELAYVNGVVWQENSQKLWWAWESGSWTPYGGTSTNPLASPSGTVVQGTSGHITDNQGNVWAINSQAVVTVNGVVSTSTANVIELAYVNGVVWQENSQKLWWAWESGSWTPYGGTSISPLPSTTTTTTTTTRSATTTTTTTHTTTTTLPPQSPSGTVVVGTNGHIVDSQHNIWAIDSAGVITINGVAQTATANVIELAYVNGVVWQESSVHLWWAWASGSWIPLYGTSVSPLSSPSGRFIVSNGKVWDPKGNPWVGRGINVADAQMAEVCTSASCDPLLSVFPGLNFVRINCYSYNPPSYYLQFISWATAKGIVVELEDHTNTEGNNGGNVGVVYTGTLLTNELNWYTSIATAFASNPYVWFGTDNEPAVNPSIAALSTWQQQTYNAIRATGM